MSATTRIEYRANSRGSGGHCVAGRQPPKRGAGSWVRPEGTTVGSEAFGEQFFAPMWQCRIEECIPEELLGGVSLLCSEDNPDHCDRRLLVECLRDRWDGLDITHLE